MTSDAFYSQPDPIVSPQGDILSQQTQLSSIDYTAWDYAAVKRMLYRVGRSVFGDKYNNFVESDFGVMAMEYLAAHADFVAFKADYAVNESMLLTASLPKNIRRHARARGYIPRPKMAARYDMSITVADPYSVDIVIESGFQIRSSGIDAELLTIELYQADSNGDPVFDEDIIIPAGARSISNVVGIEGETRAVSVSGQGIPYQKINLPDNNTLPTTVEVYVDGTRWTEVESLYNQGPKEVYMIDVDDRMMRYSVVAGDGRRGKMFPEDSQVEVVYRLGGGERGNIPSGFVSVTETIAIPSSGISAPITFVNRSRGRGGDDGESSEEIRANLPFFWKRQGRLASLEDYSSFATTYYAEGIGRVAKGRSYVRHAGCSANIIDIYILEKNRNNEVVVPSDGLLQSLSEAIEPIKIATHSPCVRPGKIVETDVQVYADFPRSYSSRKSEMESLVRGAIGFFFSLETWTFGRPLKKAELTKFILGSTPAVNVEVDFQMDPGFEMVDGHYKSLHNELVRPRTPDVNVSFNGDSF